MKLIVWRRQLISLWNIMELPPHTHTTVFRHHGMLSTFDFGKFRGRRFLIPSLIPLKCNVPMDTTRSPSVQRVASWCSWGRSQPGGRWFRQLTFITIYLGRAIYNIQVDRISNHMLFTHTISSRMTHKVLMCIHKHHHGTPSGCPHKRILHILATTSLPCPMIHSLGAHWVLTWLLTWLLTWYSLGTHLVLTWCSLGAHRVLTGCSLGAHWPNLAARPWCIYRVAPQFPTMKNMHFAAEGYQKIDVPEHRMVYNTSCERNTTPAKHFETRLKRIRNALKNFCNAFVTLV